MKLKRIHIFSILMGISLSTISFNFTFAFADEYPIPAGETWVALSPTEEEQLQPPEIHKKLAVRMSEACRIFGKTSLSSYEEVYIPTLKLSAQELKEKLLSEKASHVRIPADLKTVCHSSEMTPPDSEIRSQTWSERYFCGWSGDVSASQILGTVAVVGCLVGLPTMITAMGDGLEFWSVSSKVLDAMLGLGIPCPAIGGTACIAARCPSTTGLWENDSAQVPLCSCCPTYIHEAPPVAPQNWSIFTNLVCKKSEEDNSSASSISRPSIESSSAYQNMTAETDSERSLEKKK